MSKVSLFLFIGDDLTALEINMFYSRYGLSNFNMIHNHLPKSFNAHSKGNVFP